MKKNSPGFLYDLQKQLESLPLTTLEAVNREGGFEIAQLLQDILNPVDHSVYMPYVVDPGTVKSTDTNDAALGEDAITSGRVAYCVIASSPCTKPVPGLGRSLLQIKTLQAADFDDFWVLASPSEIDAVQAQLIASGRPDAIVLRHYESLCLSPVNSLAQGDQVPSTIPCGSGDLPVVLRSEGLLDDFVSRSGKYIFVVDVNNVAASPSRSLLGRHIEGGRPVTCEVTTREFGDTEPVLCNHEGFDQLVEQIRLLHNLDVSDFPHIGTGTYVFNANVDLETLKAKWLRVKKSLSGKSVVHYERSLTDLTATFQSQFVEAVRSSRYLRADDHRNTQTIPRIFGQ